MLGRPDGTGICAIARRVAARPELAGLHAQGDSLEEATESAREALELYVEGLGEDGRSLEMGIVRRKLQLPA